MLLEYFPFTIAFSYPILTSFFFSLLTVTHDLDVVVKGNLSLFRIQVSLCSSNVLTNVCLCARGTHLFFFFTDGCPGLCSGHGRCTLEQSGWRCVCQAGWSGPGCSVVMETDCSDGTDNDGGDILTSSIIFYLFLSFLTSFISCLCGRSSIPFHYFSSCSSSDFIVPPPALSQSCRDSCRVLLVIILLNMYLCVCVCVHLCAVCMSVFPLLSQLNV